MPNYNDIPVGLRIPSNLPLDAKLWIKSSEDLENLGFDNNLAYTYYRGMRVYCADEREIYEWMRVEDGNNLGLPNLPTSIFTYPAGYIVNDVNYSNDTYCFFKIPQAWDIVIPTPPVVPGVENVGSGADIYKGLTGGNHQFRGITAEVTKPTNPGQINGTNDITFNAQVNGDNIEIKIDLSTLTVPLQQVGIPQFYVNSAANATIADGSIVRPYKTWEACRTAIIRPDLGGTFANPNRLGVKVIFQTNIDSAEDLSIRSVSYAFENNAVFKYTGTADAAFDVLKLESAGVATSGHRFEGTGVIQVTTPKIGIRSGNSNPSTNYFHVAFAKGSNIVIRERASNTQMTNGTFFLGSDGAGGPVTDGASRPVYFLSKSGGNDVIPVNEGLISIKGHNSPVWETFQVEEGANLLIQASINRAVYIENGNFINYGNVTFDTTSGELGGQNYSIARYETINPAIGDIEGRYTPSNSVSQIYLLQTEDSPTSAASFNTSGSGSISGYLLGGIKQGGYKSVIELAGKGSSFYVTSSNAMTWSNRMRYRHLVYFADTQTNGGGTVRKQFNVNDIYTRVWFEDFIIGGVSGVAEANSLLLITNGDLETDSQLNKIKSPTLSGLRIHSTFTTFAATLYSSNTRAHATNALALAANLIPGMWYYNTTIQAISIVQ